MRVKRRGGATSYRPRVATWADVERVGLTLPETRLGDSHGGEPVVLVRTQQFARFRRNDDGEVLQFWVAHEDLVGAQVTSAPETFWGAPGFSRKVVMARLGALDAAELREVLVESWTCRATATLRKGHPGLR
jgi:hypothetical protein